MFTKKKNIPTDLKDLFCFNDDNDVLFYILYQSAFETVKL